MYCKQSLLHRQLQKDIAAAPGSAFTSFPPPSSAAPSNGAGSIPQQGHGGGGGSGSGGGGSGCSWAERRRRGSGGGNSSSSNSATGGGLPKPHDRQAKLTPSQVSPLLCFFRSCLIPGSALFVVYQHTVVITVCHSVLLLLLLRFM